MHCERCHTKFCWECLQTLPEPNPYDHFKDNPSCWRFQTQPEKLAQIEILQAVSLEDTMMRQLHADSAANCPKCMAYVLRSPSRVNLLTCDICRLFFCFNCGKKIGDISAGEEAAKLHFEIAFCHYKPL